jgi:hypothetical protein
MPSLLSDKKDIYIFVRMLHQTSHQIHSSLLKRKAATLVSTLPLKQGNRNKNPQKLYVATWLAFSHSRFDPDSQPKKLSYIALVSVRADSQFLKGSISTALRCWT